MNFARTFGRLLKDALPIDSHRKVGRTLKVVYRRILKVFSYCKRLLSGVLSIKDFWRVSCLSRPTKILQYKNCCLRKTMKKFYVYGTFKNSHFKQIFSLSNAFEKKYIILSGEPRSNSSEFYYLLEIELWFRCSDRI